jgi:hypothetical protein
VDPDQPNPQTPNALMILNVNRLDPSDILLIKDGKPIKFHIELTYTTPANPSPNMLYTSRTMTLNTYAVGGMNNFTYADNTFN